MSEHIILSTSKGWMGLLNLQAVRLSCVEACLEAMIEERRFQYTDLFVRS